MLSEKLVDMAPASCPAGAFFPELGRGRSIENKKLFHVSEIIRLVNEQYGITMDRESVVSALTKKVKKGVTFIRTGTNIFGDGMTAEMFNDDAIGRVLDRIYDYGTWKLFSEVCIQVFRNFNVDCSIINVTFKEFSLCYYQKKAELLSRAEPGDLSRPLIR
jgi:hypothetical protein